MTTRTQAVGAVILILVVVAVTISLIALLTVRVAPAHQFAAVCHARHCRTPTPSPSATPSPTPTSVATPTPTASGTPSGTYTFDDEFNGVALDPNKWWRETRWDGDTRWQTWCSWSDDPRLYSVANGVLTLTALRVNQTKPYICPIISTQGKFTQTNGIWQARMKWDRGHALWPAFWLHNPPNTIDEIDVMEAYPEPAHPDYYTETTHWVGGQQTHNNYVDADWHVYEVEWRGTTTTYRRDGVTQTVITGPIAQVQMFNILNLMVGVWWQGWAPDATTPNAPTLQVDWVRVSP